MSHNSPAEADARRDESLFSAAMAVNSLGNGAFVPISAIFFARVSGMPIPLLGATLTVAAGLGLVAGPAVGRLSDRISPRLLYAILLAIQGAGVALYIAPVPHLALAVLLILVAMAERGAAATRGTFIGRLVSRDRRVAFRARVRAITNAAAAIGAALASLVLTSDTDTAYHLGILANATTFVVSGALLAACRPKPALAASGCPAQGDTPLAQGRKAVRDRPFLVITGLNAALLLHATMLTFALPLWIAQHTTAPLWLVSALVLTNTIGVVLLQVKATRGVNDLSSAGRAGRRSALLLAGACLAIAPSGIIHASWASACLLLLAALFHLGGELLQAASGWTFAFDMAPEDRLGEYQGVFNAGLDVGQLISPVVFTTMIAGGSWSWVALAALFVIVGQLFGPSTRWAQETRLMETPAPA